MSEADTWPQWRPIKTAPRDGTEILVWGEKQDGAYLASWDEATFAWWSPDECPLKWTDLSDDPTHWLPLPPPPEGKT